MCTVRLRLFRLHPASGPLCGSLYLMHSFCTPPPQSIGSYLPPGAASSRSVRPLLGVLATSVPASWPAVCFETTLTISYSLHCSLDCRYWEGGACACLGVSSLSPQDLAHIRCSIKACPDLNGARVPLHLQLSRFVGVQTEGLSWSRPRLTC